MSYMNHDQHPAIAAIDSDIKTVTNAQAGATVERDRTALAVRVGTDKSAPKKLEALAAELASYAAQLDTLAGARRAAVEAAAADNHTARKELLAANVADAISASKVRVESAAKIEKAIAALGQALEQHNAHGLLAWSSLSRSADLVGGIEPVLSLKDSAVGGGSAIAATQALYFAIQRANSLGGARIHVDFPGLATVHGGVGEGAEHDLQRIERATAEWNVIESERATPTPAVIERLPRIEVRNGVSEVVGLEGSQYV